MNDAEEVTEKISDTADAEFNETPADDKASKKDKT